MSSNSKSARMFFSLGSKPDGALQALDDSLHRGHLIKNLSMFCNKQLAIPNLSKHWMSRQDYLFENLHESNLIPSL